MINYETIINFINEIKYKLKTNHYCKSDDLEFDIYKISELIWSDIQSVKQADLNNLCSIHEYLINKVCKIHKLEEDFYNNELLKGNINIKNIKSKINDGKRASNIYVFNNSDYDYYFIGDLHSDDFSLKRIMAQCNFFDKIIKGNKIRLIFLGDYVDRGKAHFKLLEMIFVLKYLFPGNVYLLRGNHDGGSINGDKVKLWTRIGEHENEDDYFLMYIYNLSKVNNSFSFYMIEKYLEFFNGLCNIAFVNYKDVSILGVHGGIPRAKKDDLNYYNYLNCISDLTNESIVDIRNRSIVDNMLWSDPYDDQGDLREDSGRFRFTQEHFEEFKKTFGFDILIRGHEAEKNGYKKFFNDGVYTIFSSGMILEDNININCVTAYYNVTPRIIKIREKGEIEIVPVM